MVKATAQVECNVRLALDEQIGGSQGGTRSPGAVFKHVAEDRRVRSSQPHVEPLHREFPAGRLLECVQIPGRVESAEI